MRSKTYVVALFLFAACLIPRMSVASTVTLTLEPSNGSPYVFSINGSSTFTDLSCLNNGRTVYVGESWTAIAVNLNTLVSNPLNTKSTVITSGSTNSGMTLGQLEADAYLDSKYTSKPTSITNIELQDAIWSVLDGKLGQTSTYVYSGLTGGINGTEDQAVQNYVSAAESTSELSSFYSQFTFYYPQTWGARDSEPQQFMGFAPAVTPEPSSLILLGTGIVGFAGAMRRRFMASNLS